MHAFVQAFVPASIIPLVVTGVIAGTSIWIGALLPVANIGRRGRWSIGWGWLLVSLAAVHLALISAPAGYRMLAIVLITLLGTKALVHVEWVLRQLDARPLTPLQYGLFALGWLGMRPEVFSVRHPRPVSAPGWLLRGTACFATGGLLLVLAREWSGGIITDLLLLAGLSLTLHFGLLTLSAWAFRRAGFRANLLFRNPFAAKTLSDFWARYWNLGYVEMTSRLVHRPARQFLSVHGRNGAIVPLLIAFAFSGLLHEAAITLPVMRAFGLPLGYFTLHAALVIFESEIPPVRLFLTGHPFIARLWVIGTLALPLPLLFVRPFVDQVLRPLIGL